MSTADEGSIKYIFDLLEYGVEKLDVRPHQDIVLILGNTGSGKSTLAQFLAGDNKDLEAVEVDPDSGDFVIIDKYNKISGRSTILSKTIFPDLFIKEDTGTLFYDCPGFSDTRSAAHDIATTYFIKKVIDSAKSVKLVFLVNHSSVRKGVDRRDFITLLKHAASLLIDIEKYSNSMALIVTKVDNQFKHHDDGSVSLVSDEVLIKSIFNFLEIVKEDVQTQASFPNIKLQDYMEFRTKAIKLIDIFLQSNGTYHMKIGLFRRPVRSGPINESALLQKGKKSLLKIVNNNINFIKKNGRDFGYTISPESMVYIQDLGNEINQCIRKKIENMGEKIKKYSMQQEKVISDIFLLHNKFMLNVKTFSKYDTNAPEESKNFIKTLFQDVHAISTIDSDTVKKIVNFDDYLSFFEFVSKRSLKMPLQWCQGLKSLMKYFNNSKEWYKFLIDLNAWLSEYGPQKYRSEFQVAKLLNNYKYKVGDYEYIKASEIDLIPLLKNVERHKENFKIEEIVNRIKNINVCNTKLGYFRRSLELALHHNTSMLCTKENSLVIKGHFVHLSEEISKKCPQDIKYIEVFALNKVFIDIDLYKIGEEVQLSIIAPIWEIIGNRRIVLDGAEGSPHSVMKDTKPGMKGEDGVPGRPGGPAGHFFGVVDDIIGGKLEVSVVGGPGGAGQVGGLGGSGWPGKNPNYRPSMDSFMLDEWGPEEDWEYEGINWRFTDTTNYLLKAWYNYRAEGTKATPGADGGNGGSGGLGGKAGSVTIVSSGKNDKIVVHSHDGPKGPEGRGGEGGSGANNGLIYFIICDYTRIIIFLISSMSCEETKREGNGLSSRGNPGKDGENILGIIQPASTKEMGNHIYILNNYKYFLRSTLTEGLQASVLVKFMNGFERSTTTSGLYDTLGLVNEFEGLENQYHFLNGNVDVIPFYQSLLDRVNNYSMYPKPTEKTIEFKKIRAYLYTAILSKIFNLKRRLKDDLVIDTPKYLGLVERNIKELQKIQSTVAINEVLDIYREGIEEQISYTEENIKLNIIPKFHSIFDELDDRISILLNDTINMIQTAQQNYEILRRKEQELANSLLLRKLLSPINMIKEFLNLVGPVVRDVTEMFTIGLDAVSEYLSFSSQGGNGKDALISHALSMAEIAKKFLSNVDYITKDERILYNSQISDVISKMKNHLVSSKGSALQEIYNNINENGTLLENEEPYIINPSTIELKRQNVKNYLIKQQIILGNKSSENLEELKLLSDSQKIIELNHISPQLYESVRQDSRKVDYLSEAMEAQKEKIKALKTFEKNIYFTIIPYCHKLKTLIQIDERSLRNKNRFDIDIQHWWSKTIINNIKFEIHQLTKKVNIGEDLQRSFEKIDETLSIILNLYSRIGDYHDKSKLGAYIADINSPEAHGIILSNRNLKTALQTLDLSIKSNLILEQYSKGIDAFTQFVFPFANLYLNEFKLPPSFNLSSNLDSLVFIASQTLEKLKLKLVESSASLNKYDEYIYKDIKFNSDTKQSKPFFVWKSELNEKTISNMLLGSKVNLKADISEGIDENAIKFNDIGLNFKAHNTSLQETLNEDLSNFEVRLVHQGNSYYKCGTAFYTITSKKQTFQYHIQKDEKGQPISRNLVHDKVKMNDAVLSPYAMWTVKLVHPLDNFRTLHKYLNEKIDIELVGHGQYLKKGSLDYEVCGSDMTYYYHEDDSISEFDNRHNFMEQLPDNLSAETYSRRKRSVDDEDLARSGASSNAISSPINNIINTIARGISLVQWLYPFEQMRKWINPISNVVNDFASSYAPPEWADDHLMLDRLANENIKVQGLPSRNFFESQSNLLLWNLFLRKLGKKPRDDKYPFYNSQFELAEYSHSLAYSYYADKEHNPLPESYNFS